MWYQQEDEEDKCKAAGSACLNLSELESASKTFLGVTALGVGAVIVGFVIDKDGSSGFRLRAINNGLEIERDGLSFSALNTGQM